MKKMEEWVLKYFCAVYNVNKEFMNITWIIKKNDAQTHINIDFSFYFSSVERRIYSAGKTFLCFVAFLICIQPLLLCYFGECFAW